MNGDSMKEKVTALKNIIMQPLYFSNITVLVLDVIFANHAPDWNFSTHYHPWFEFNYVDSGDMYTTLDGQEFHVDSGSSFIIPPGRSHSHRSNALIGDMGICLRWQVSQNKNRGNLYYDFMRVMTAPRNAAFNSAFGILSAGDSAIKNQLSFLSWLMNLYEEWSGQEGERNLSRHYVSNQVILYMNEYFGKKIGVQEIAHAMNMSYRNLSRIFKQETGITIIEKLNEIRINKAKELLIENELPICEIAETVGFENEHYFSNTFRKYAYSTPAAFKKSVNGGK